MGWKPMLRQEGRSGWQSGGGVGDGLFGGAGEGPGVGAGDGFDGGVFVDVEVEVEVVGAELWAVAVLFDLGVVGGSAGLGFDVVIGGLGEFFAHDDGAAARDTGGDFAVVEDVVFAQVVVDE